MSELAPGTATPMTLQLVGDVDAAACTGDSCAVPPRPLEPNHDKANDEAARTPGPTTVARPSA